MITVFSFNGALLTLDISSTQDPLKLDVVISFPDHGFHLRFDPWSQVLYCSLSIVPYLNIHSLHTYLYYVQIL